LKELPVIQNAHILTDLARDRHAALVSEARAVTLAKQADTDRDREPARRFTLRRKQFAATVVPSEC
jgi:hypothetical protein